MMLVEEEMEPATPCAAARPACDDTSTNRGNATAERIPRMTITTTSSINVKPCCLLFIEMPENLY